MTWGWMGPTEHARSRLRWSLPIAALLALLFPATALAAPDTTIEEGPAQGASISDETPSFTFSSNDLAATFECRVDSDSFAACSNPHTTGALLEGEHTFYVRAVDQTTLPDPTPDDTPASRTFTVDKTPPGQPTIDSGPDEGSTIPDSTPTFGFSSEAGATFECRVDADPFGPCSGPGDSHTTGALDDGSHTFRVRVTDAAGNTNPIPSIRTFIVDTTPPSATIDSGPAGGSTIPDSPPTFGFSSDDSSATFECRIDTASFGPCSGPGDSHTTVALADGAHTFEVRATDAIGNTNPTPASRSFTVDTTPPDTEIDSGPSGTTADATPTFDFSGGGAGATYECRVDAGGFGACSGPGRSHTTDVLADGAHTFAVRATDAAGNVDLSPATRAFTVDATAPAVEITNQPAARVQTREKSARVAVEFLSEAGAAFECRLDDRDYKPCSSPFSTSAGSASGEGREHSISVRATDAVGNTGAPTRIEFRVRRTPPLEKRVALKTVRTALKRHGFARRVVKSVEADCKRLSRYQFACRFSTRFPGYKMRGRGKVRLGDSLSYEFRVKAQGVRLTLSDENEG